MPCGFQMDDELNTGGLLAAFMSAVDCANRDTGRIIDCTRTSATNSRTQIEFFIVYKPEDAGTFCFGIRM